MAYRNVPPPPPPHTHTHYNCTNTCMTADGLVKWEERKCQISMQMRKDAFNFDLKEESKEELKYYSLNI